MVPNSLQMTLEQRITSSSSTFGDSSSSSSSSWLPVLMITDNSQINQRQQQKQKQQQQQQQILHQHRKSILTQCLCFPINNHVNSKSVAESIKDGDEQSLIYAIMKIKTDPKNKYYFTIKRKVMDNEHLIHFHQECGPLLWAVDCQQWHLIPLLCKFGFSPNRPLCCRRWTTCSAIGTQRSNTSPYKCLWTRGKYSYQSALDYYFARIYETMGSDFIRKSIKSNLENDNFLNYFEHLDYILHACPGLDVHRIDSVIIMNKLASSFDSLLAHHLIETTTTTTDNNNSDNVVGVVSESAASSSAVRTICDIPLDLESLVELRILRTLISHGYSEFECLEFLSPCYHWLGLLMCLLCHPRMNEFITNNIHQHTSLPPIFREAALLLINIISLRCLQPFVRPAPFNSKGFVPTSEQLLGSLGHLRLRKLYVKRYTEDRLNFHRRLLQLRRLCHEMHFQPLSLRLLCRNKIRSRLGGIEFQQRLSQLPLPKELHKFIQYIDLKHLKSHEVPSILFSFALGNFGLQERLQEEVLLEEFTI